MNGNPHPNPTGRCLAFLIFALASAFCQQVSSLPAWLQNYPGASPAVRLSDSLVESSYTIAAQPADILQHYRKLFEAAGLPFQPNPDGIGTSIRAAASECDLLILIRTREAGTFVDVNCSAKTEPAAQSSLIAAPNDVGIPTRPQTPSTKSPPPRPVTTDEIMEQHRQKAAEMGLHRVHPDAPAPPLVWPSWLVQTTGAALRTERGVNFEKDAMLKAQYTTNVPMTEIYRFYRDLLNAHEYPARSSISTGHTESGIQQNAIGYVEGYNYPDGAPGAYSTIYVSFDRSVLNGPITVSLRFTTHEYIAKRGY
jgi:hypothetical protein